MKSLTEIATEARIFGAVPGETVAAIVAKGHLREVERGASILLQGERAHSMFIILDGWIKLYRMSPCGNEAVVRLLSRGECFGETAAVRGEVFATGAEAVSNARLLQLDCHDVWHAVEHNVDLCRSMLNAVLRENTELVHQLEQLKSLSGAQRIARFLLSLCKDETGECTVILPYDKVLIAACLGMKPESLSRSFRRLSVCGVKISRDRAIIESVERLARFTEEDMSDAWNAKTSRTG